MLHQVPGDEGSRDAAVAIWEGVDLREPVEQPCCHRQGVVDVRLGAVVGVPVEQVVDFRFHMDWRAVLVEDAVGSGCWAGF